MDVVYTYVNFKDNNWKNEYVKYSGRQSVRVCSLNELELSVKHTLTNCLFVRNIFIVTDNQIPSWYCKDLYKKVKIIYHKDIFDENCIYPTYNSNTIECYLHKIPDLSETFLYLNDDFFINLKKKENLFDKESKLPYAFVLNRNWNYSLEIAKKKHRNNPATYAVYNTIKMAEKFFNKKFNITYTHQAYILTKSSCKLTEKFFLEQYKKKVKMRFRVMLSNDDFIFPLLSNIVGSENNLCKLKNFSKTNFSKVFLNLSIHNVDKLNIILKKEPNFFCINDITRTKNKELMQKYYTFSNEIRKKLSNDKNMVSISLSDILYINLDRSKNRLIKFNENLKNNIFNIIRIPAFDGKTLSDIDFDNLKKNKNMFLGLPTTHKTQYACWKSHIKCYNYIVNNFIEWCIILEDDTLLKPGLTEKFKNFSVPCDTDIIFIHKRSEKCARANSSFKDFDICIDGWGSDGYIISYNCAKKILDSIYSKIYFMQIDTLLFCMGKNYKSRFRSRYRTKLQKNNIKIENIKLSTYVTKNSLINQMDVKSTITHKS